jgi:hypothetical protein
VAAVAAAATAAVAAAVAMMRQLTPPSSSDSSIGAISRCPELPYVSVLQINFLIESFAITYEYDRERVRLPSAVGRAAADFSAAGNASSK